MLINRVFTALALVALVGTAACGGDAEDAEMVEEQALPITTETEAVAPEAIQGTVQMDTTGAGAVVDTTYVPPQN
jgi:hypothetical protein